MEKEKIIHIYSRELDLDLNIDVEFLDVRIISGTVEEIYGDNHSSDRKNDHHIAIIIKSELESFEAINDGLAYTRPKLLIAFGALSFYTQEVFSPFEMIRQFSDVGDYNKKCSNRFIFNGDDLLTDFKLFEAKILQHDDEGFIFSLLDRWRKGLFLEARSEENMLYDDETVLSYFHILELLTTKYQKDQKKEIKETIKKFTDEVFEESFLYNGNRLESESKNYSKTIENLILPKVNVSSKIFYMLKQQGLLSARLKSFISDFVEDRNAVAHGRQVYQSKVIFPVPPFFPLVKNRFYPDEFYRVLTARCIASYIGINLYSSEWESMSELILPSIEEVKEFYNAKRFMGLSNKDFCDGTINDITPYTITHYLINKKLKPKQALEILEEFILNYEGSESETQDSIWSILIVLDLIDDEKLREKCIEIIKIAGDNRWHFDYFKLRDAMYRMEYYGFEVRLFKEMIQKREIR